jgi:predicted choloylglycine hydrolase
MKSVKKKLHKLRKKILKALLILAIVVVIALIALLYGPVKSMASLEKVDDFPLYVMKYSSEYFFDLFAEFGTEWCLYQEIYEKVNPDACTSFVTLNPESEKIFARNFDWKHKASLLLFTEPSDGYASVSMVDLYYLGFEGMQEIPWSKRFILLGAPYATIDGMNECGVAIAQNEVPKRHTPKVPDRPTLLNSMMVRLVLDHASNVDEAIALILQYNIEFANVWAHFHIVDASGNSAVVEYVDGGVAVVRNENPWQVSTNFHLSEIQQKDCWRYNIANESLTKTSGKMSEDEAMEVLRRAKNHTVWSVVYNLSTGRVQLAMGEDYENVHSFELKMAERPSGSKEQK